MSPPQRRGIDAPAAKVVADRGIRPQPVFGVRITDQSRLWCTHTVADQTARTPPESQDRSGRLHPAGILTTTGCATRMEDVPRRNAPCASSCASL